MCVWCSQAALWWIDWIASEESRLTEVYGPLKTLSQVIEDAGVRCHHLCPLSGLWCLGPSTWKKKKKKRIEILEFHQTNHCESICMMVLRGLQGHFYSPNRVTDYPLLFNKGTNPFKMFFREFQLENVSNLIYKTTTWTQVNKSKSFSQFNPIFKVVIGKTIFFSTTANIHSSITTNPNWVIPYFRIKLQPCYSLYHLNFK